MWQTTQSCLCAHGREFFFCFVAAGSKEAVEDLGVHQVSSVSGAGVYVHVGGSLASVAVRNKEAVEDQALHLVSSVIGAAV